MASSFELGDDGFWFSCLCAFFVSVASAIQPHTHHFSLLLSIQVPFHFPLNVLGQFLMEMMITSACSQHLQSKCRCNNHGRLYYFGDVLNHRTFR